MMTSLMADVREMLAEQVQYRELLLQMTRRDLLLRYKQTIMGFGWAVFMPLINTVIFSVVFMQVAKVETPVAYPVYAYCGLAAWNFFASSLRFAVNSLTSNTNLVTKIYFPREIFPFSVVIVSLVDFAVSSLVLVAMMIYYGIGVSSSLAWLPVVLLVHIMMTAGVSLWLAMANLFYRDVKYLFEVVITVWMFATSVLYPMSAVGGRLGTVLLLNPLTPIIDAFRSTILLGRAPSAAFWGAGAAALVILFTGWIVFHRAEFKFAESV
jgi:lipopolysaccharide transport system permease protein